MLLFTLSIIAFSYCIGSLSFAIIVSRTMKLKDPRTFGSYNPGATNVLRSGNKTAAALTFLGDGFKGWAIVSLTRVLLNSPPPFLEQIGSQIIILDNISISLVYLVGLFVIIGHMWPIFFGFQGGKGVAAAFGVLTSFSPLLGISVLAVWLIVAYLFRISSVAALAAAISAPFLTAYLLKDSQAVIIVLFIVILILLRHKKNIVSLATGNETRIGDNHRSHF